MSEETGYFYSLRKKHENIHTLAQRLGESFERTLDILDEYGDFTSGEKQELINYHLQGHPYDP